MSDESIKILEMVAQGKITPVQADRLLGALKDESARQRLLKIRICDRSGDRPKIKIDVPVAVLKLASKMGSVFKGLMPEGFSVNVSGKVFKLDDFNPEVIDQIVNGIPDGGRFSIASVTDEEKNEQVEVYIE